MSISRIAVVGAGIMGRGIAQVVLRSGYEAVLVDRTDELVRDAGERIGRALRRQAERADEAPEVADDSLGRLELATDLAGVASDVDYVIEAVTEDLDVKAAVFRTLDEHGADDVILATNSSQFSITTIASATRRPDRVIGTHWFNPPPVMRLIEVINGELTSAETLATTLELCHAFGKETIVCKKDTQGFVTSRLIMLFILEATRIYEEGIASVEDIDKACKLAFNHAMGPFDTADLSGLDTLLKGADAMSTHYGERYRAPQTLRRLVAAERLGAKTGAGFRATAG